jgi:hypothetical protein
MWPGRAFANATDLGTNTATSTGTTLTAHASVTYSMGSWTQITSATPHDCAWMMVTLPQVFNTGVSIAVDIGIGSSGNEIVVVPNLMCSASWPRCLDYLFPLAIPAGTRIAARLSSNVLSDTTPIAVHIFDDTFGSPGTGSAIDTYGFQSNLNIGTAVDPGGTANTKGSYVTIASSITNDLTGIWMTFDTQASNGSAAGYNAWLVDVAVGAAASEQIFLPNISMTGQFATSNAWIMNPMMPYYPMPIPAGTRISARSLCTTNSSPSRILGMTLWGARQ